MGSEISYLDIDLAGVGLAAGLMAHAERLEWNLDELTVIGADGTNTNTGWEVRNDKRVDNIQFLINISIESYGQRP